MKEEPSVNLFPDLDMSTIPVLTTQNTAVSNESKDSNPKHNNTTDKDETDSEEEATIAKEILLKYQCMPLYPVTRKSREQLDSFLERYKTSTGKNWLSNIGQANETETGLNSSTLREYAVILHSLFSEFCTPHPSIASVYRIVILESTRVASLKGRDIHQSTSVSDRSDYAKDLPKEPLVHTTISSAQFVIALLRSPSKGCLLTLPMEFLLSFFRLLVRLLSEEDDQEYDDECLFDWSFDTDNHGARNERVNNEEDARGVKKDCSSDSELDSSYHVVQRGVLVSSNNQCPAVDSTTVSSRKSEVRQSSSAADIVTQAWTYGSWKKKKSSPLYSAIRFCSNLAWGDNATASASSSQTISNCTSRVSQRQRWNFVADNVQLDEAEEEELNNENVFEEGRSNGSMKLLGTLINIYHSILDESCKKSDHPNFKYLLLGPTAHLLGLVVSAVGLSVKDLRKLLIIADGSDSWNSAFKQSSRKRSMSGNPSTQLTQQFSLYLGRLHIIRMMRYAAEYSTQSTGILDKVGPQSFFSFGDGGDSDGLFASLENKHWPFKHDFGMACWFRAETFGRASFRGGNGNKNQDSVLFRARTQDGGQIEVSFESCSGGTDDIFASAATLLITITDAHGPDVQKTPRKVRLVGCVLSPLVWYHVAVRLTKSKPSPFSLNKTNELSIFINGKLMLRTQMKLPRFPDSTNGGLSSSLASIGLGSFSRPVSNGNKKSSPIEFTFFSHIDGQAGALYVFNELVSDETIQSLYTSMSSQSEQGSPWFTFSDGWDISRSKLGHIAQALSSASMLSELEDIVLPDYPILIGILPRKTKVLIDVPEEELNPSTPAGLSKANFGSKLFIVWDPSRIRNQTVVDIHSRIDAILPNCVSSWSFEEGIKDTLSSLGGPKRLIPVFSTLPETATLYGQNRHFKMKGINQDFPNMFTPNIMFLVSSFIRDHVRNGRELYRCGGIHVMHKIFHDCKQKQLECSSGAYCGMGASSAMGKYNVSALLDLWHSSRRVFGLEITIFSQLLFNVPLLLGGVSTCDGPYLHTNLLPVLSYITRQNPEKVRDCVGTSSCFDCIREYSMEVNEEDVMNNQESPELYVPFQRPHFCMGRPSHLTSLERRIVVDFLLGMVATMLSNSCPANDLSPLVTFLTHNLDGIWQQDKQNTKNVSADNSDSKSKQPRSSGNYGSRYFATLKAVNVLFFLLQKSPPIPHIIESLTLLLENANGVASWVLCSMVNQYDDNLRGLGIRCLVAYLHSTFTTGSSFTQHDGSTVKLSSAVKYGLGVISSSSNVLASLLAGRGNVKVIYKLLFHLLKCHRERLGEHSNTALMYLLVDDSSIDVKQSLALSDLVVENKSGGVRLDIENLDISQSKLNVAATLSRQNIRNVYGVSALMRLLRYMSNEQKERWLFDLLALILASSSSISVILSCDDWQPCLFQLVAEVLEEINEDISDNDTSNSHVGRSQDVRKFDTRALSKPSVRTRYDLSLKLYSSLLGHCVRKGDDKAFAAVETAASLQRVDVNGPDVFGIVLSHLLADLIEKGTVEFVEDTYEKEPPSIKNRALKQSARLVTQAVLTNGSGELDMAAAVKQWRSLRHLTALATALVTDFGFGITQLFDYQLQDAAATDAITGGMYGIRLGDNLVSGINAFEALASAQLYSRDEKGGKRNIQDRHRYVSVVLASQVLTLLDAFIFPDNLDSSTSATQLHGLSLVRSSEPRLGQSQGPLLASLVRLSLILLHFLEPCSVRFLQACSRLRCFLHWALEIIRESVALGGYSVAFHDLTAPFDRVVLVIVLHCHRALSRCSTLLVEIESSPWDKYFADVDTRQKSHRRLFRAILELREIVLAAYRGRNEVLRASLSPQAHDALSRGLEGGDLLSPKKPSNPPANLTSREESIRTFLAHDWVTGFHDVQTVGSTILPDSVGTMGKEVFLTLASESAAIINDYKTVMNAPWKAFCEHQRKWAETDAVREMEHSGDLIVKKLASKECSNALESNKLMIAGLALASSRFSTLLKLAREPWTKAANWKFSCFTDLLFRRIVFSRIADFDDHRFASYELTLGKDREHLQEEEKLRREEEMKAALIQAGEAIVPYRVNDEVEEEDLEESFVGWNENIQNDGTPRDDDGVLEPISIEETSLTTDTRDNRSEMDWDQLDFDETTDNSDPYLWAKRFVWSEGETFVRTFDSVLLVTLQSNTKGSLLLSSYNLYFHQTGQVIDVMTREKVDTPTQDKKWKLNRLTDIQGRRYMLKGQALELFFADMRGVFIAFNGSKERDLFFAKLRTNCKAPLLRPLKSLNPRTIFKKSKVTELWRKRKLNNFQYIMALNLMAGRTFNDITQYPVFPWILADYSSEELDLTDQKIYRDLSKPVGALNPDRLASLIERFNELDGFPEEEKFLYGSHYSSPGVVLHYMVRQEPFTSMHIALQSGRFDCPDRLFFDVAGCWRSCLSSTSDVKELTPEFFTCPEIFLNTNAFPLGKTQNKTPVDNVILPPWAKGSAHEFIHIHQLALESDYVSQNLHHWIDLIFGYKQRGPESAAAHNIFHYLSYEGAVDIDKITDEVQRSAIEGHIQNFGQTPSQLIVKDPHPQRLHADNIAGELFPETSTGYDNLQCSTPSKQFGDQRYNEAFGAIVSLQLQGDSIFAIHSDFTLCSYKLYPSRGTIPFQFKHDRARKIDSRTSYVVQSSSPDILKETSSVVRSDLSQMSTGFALAKGGSEQADEPSNGIMDVSFFLMSIGYYDNSVKVHSIDSLQLYSCVNGVHRGQINCIETSVDGTVVVTGGHDGTCTVWVVDYEDFAVSIADGVVQPREEGSHDDFLKCCHVLLGHTSPITCIAISTKLDIVVSGSRDGSICLHNIRSGRFVRSLHVNAVSQDVENACAGNAIPVSKLAIHSNGIFVAHLHDGSLHVITVNGHRLVHTQVGEMLNSIVMCPQSETLITGGEHGLARMWNLHDLTAKCTVDVSKYGQITSMVLVPSENSSATQFLCVGSENGLLSIVFRIP